MQQESIIVLLNVSDSLSEAHLQIATGAACSHLFIANLVKSSRYRRTQIQGAAELCHSLCRLGKLDLILIFKPCLPSYASSDICMALLLFLDRYRVIFLSWADTGGTYACITQERSG